MTRRTLLALAWLCLAAAAHAQTAQQLLLGGPGITVPQGLVGYWPLDEGSGSTASDVSGFNNAAALTGSPQWIGAVIRSGLAFTGTEFGSIPSNSRYDSTSSGISVWFKVTGGSGTQFLFGRMNQNGPGSGNGIYLLVDKTTGAVSFNISTSSPGLSAINLTSSGAYADAQWHFAFGAAAPNGGTAYLMVDTETVSGSVSHVWGFAGQVIRLGKALDPFWGGLVGGLDDPRWYSPAPSLSQAQQIRNAGLQGRP